MASATQTFQLTAAPDRVIPAGGEPAATLPEWGGVVRGPATTFILHPPIDFEISYRVDRYVAFLPFATVLSDMAVGPDQAGLRRVRLRQGGVTFVEPQTCVRARQVEPLEFLVLSIDPDHVRRLGERAHGNLWRTRTVVDLREPAAAALAAELRRALLSDPLPDIPYLEALADGLVLRLLGRFAEPAPAGPDSLPMAPGRLHRILRHIEANLDGPLPIAELAAQAGLSRSHFTRVFEQATGDPPQRFVLKRRVARARALIAEGREGLAQVALAAGFSSQAHLSTAFRKVVGVTPGQYRAAFQGEEGDEER